MRLADFIVANLDAILEEWESFAAKQLPAAAGLSPLALRDHAPEILNAFAKDLTQPQSREEQALKSKGRAFNDPAAPETAAQTHAVLRARVGFDINQLVAEYRALRASVLQLWAEAHPREDPQFEDVIRFNEAVDQAVAESVGHFHAQVTRTRDLLLGMLGHDMRTPLASIVATASYLETLNAGKEVNAAAERLIRSGASMQELLDDLTDFNRTQLGLGIRINPTQCDLDEALRKELDQLRAAHPHRQIEMTVNGDCRGCWDGARLRQVLRNLVDNAIVHGAENTSVHVSLTADDSTVQLDVANTGANVDPDTYKEMFEPLKRGLTQGSSRDALHLGLGLFVVREIVLAHGGKAGIQCSDGRTLVSACLPRQQQNGSA